MIKHDMVLLVSEKTGISERTVSKVVNSFLESITEVVTHGGKVQFSGFGTFEIVERASRKGRNAATGDQIYIPARKVPVFKASDAMKRKVIQEE